MDSSSFAKQSKNFLKELITAYSDSTGQELDLSQIRKSASDATINAIITDMGRVLSEHLKNLNYTLFNDSDEVIDYRTVHKILVGNGSGISQKNRRKINDYVIYSKCRKVKKDDHTFKGSYLIDDDFKQSKKNKKDFEIIDFYTSKSNSDIQWAGVFNECDVERSIFNRLKTIANTAFHVKNSKISAIVIGRSGSGKTTVLRRLSAEFISNPRIKVLWVYDVSEFRFESVMNINQNYLIIIDDWNKVEKAPEAKRRFLNNISELTNIRLIIGDHVLSEEISVFLLPNPPKSNARFPSLMPQAFQAHGIIDQLLFAFANAEPVMAFAAGRSSS